MFSFSNSPIEKSAIAIETLYNSLPILQDSTDTSTKEIVLFALNNSSAA